MKTFMVDDLLDLGSGSAKIRSLTKQTSESNGEENSRHYKPKPLARGIEIQSGV